MLNLFSLPYIWTFYFCNQTMPCLDRSPYVETEDVYLLSQEPNKHLFHLYIYKVTEHRYDTSNTYVFYRICLFIHDLYRRVFKLNIKYDSSLPIWPIVYTNHRIVETVIFLTNISGSTQGKWRYQAVFVGCVSNQCFK